MKLGSPASTRRCTNAPPRAWIGPGDRGSRGGRWRPVRRCRRPGGDGPADRPEPSEALGAAIVVDGHAHPGERGEVVVRSPGSGEVEVEEADRLSIAEDHVLQADVVVADDRSPFGVRHLVAPGPAGGPGLPRCFVERGDEPRDRYEGLIRLGPGREGWDRHLASMNTSRSRPSPWISTGNDAPWNPVDRSDLRNRWTDDEWNSMGGGRMHRSGRPGRHWRRRRPGTRPHAQYPKECPGRIGPSAVRLRRSSGLGSAQGPPGRKCDGWRPPVDEAPAPPRLRGRHRHRRHDDDSSSASWVA